MALLAAALLGAAGFALSSGGKQTREPASTDVVRPDAPPHPTAAASSQPFGPQPPPCFRRVCAGNFEQPIDTRMGGGDNYTEFKTRNLELLSGRGPGKYKSLEGFQAGATPAPFQTPPSAAIRAPPGVKAATPAMLHDRGQVLASLQSSMKGMNTVAPLDTQLQVARMRDAPPATRLPLGPDLQTRGKMALPNPGKRATKVPEQVAFACRRRQVRQEAPGPMRSGAGAVAPVAGSRVPGTAVKRQPQSGAVRIRDTLRRVAAGAPTGPAHRGGGGMWVGQQDKFVALKTTEGRPGVAHGAMEGEAPQSVLVGHETRRREDVDELPGPACQVRRGADTQNQVPVIAVAGTMRDCDLPVGRAGAVTMSGQRQGESLAARGEAVEASMPGTMRECDSVNDAPGPASGWKRAARGLEVGESAVRLHVDGRPMAASAAVKKRTAEGSVQEAGVRVVAQAPGKVATDGGAPAPSMGMTNVRGDVAVDTAPAPARATTQRVPGDGLSAYSRGRAELVTDRGFSGLTLATRSLVGNPLTHRV